MSMLTVWLRSRLQSGNREVVLHTLETLQGTLPPPSCLRALALLLMTDNMDCRTMAGMDTAFNRINLILFQKFNLF